MRQLRDITTYQKLRSNPSIIFKNELETLVSNAQSNGVISLRVKNYLIPSETKTPIFYHLPKVHKVERPPVGRPIVSGIQSLNERLSEYIDILLQPLVTRLASYVQDTKHILQILNDCQWHSSYSWGTVDVTSLYSCIPHDRGLRAVSYHLDRYSTYDSLLKDFILDAISYLLTHNFFKFDGNFYLQRCGTSMGAKFAPSYANLYMGWWEESHIFGGDSPFLSHVVVYKRYVDDLIFIWKDTESTFSQFVDHLNNNELNLKFTSNFSSTNITFLDLELRGFGTHIETDTYRKPCSGNSLLRADSCHPSHLFKGIPLGQFLRLRRNCSTDEAFVKQACLLRDRFLERGYTMNLLIPAFANSLCKSRLDLLTRKSMDRLITQKNKRITKKQSVSNFNVPIFITTYSRQFYEIKNVIQKFLPVLYNDSQLASVLKNGCKFVTRRAPTLGNVLSPTILKSKSAKSTWLTTCGTYRCGARRCITCTHVNCSVEFVSSVTHRTFKMRFYANCNTHHVVYLLTCARCSIQYVGCTIRSLKCRMREHIGHIVAKNGNSPVSRHFINCCNGDDSLLQIQVIDRILPDERDSDLWTRLLRAEVKWIFLLGTRHPHGLNSAFDINCYVPPK
uniref:Reverse transcriptase domain-containing protein n=1 Tax=Xenopus tropicalis TaxID=8364 RepID=A0A803JQE7_XENTR